MNAQATVTDTIKQPIILGTGQLGLAIMDELVKQGQPVTLVNRSGKVNEPLPPGVTLRTADLTDPANVARVTADADAVYFCLQPPYDRWPDLFPPLIDATIQGMAGSRAKLVFGDNLYCYGPTHGQPIHEGLPAAATGHKGRTRARMAQTLLDAHRAGTLRVTIGRGSDFYGPRCTDSTLGDIVFGAIVRGETVNLLGDIDQPHSYTYIRDFAHGLTILAAQPEADGNVWHIPNPPAISTRQMVEEIAAQAGVQPKLRVAGRTLVTLLGLFNRQLREMKEMMYEFEEPYIVDHSRFAAAFGDIATPRAEAIAATLAWFKQHRTE